MNVVGTKDDPWRLKTPPLTSEYETTRGRSTTCT